MNDHVLERLRALLGPEGLGRDVNGLPRAVPESDDALALICQAAAEEGWCFRVEGRTSWLAPDAPADFALSTRGLDRLVSVSPADLVATVQAGMPLSALHAELVRQGMWLALDPPGRPDRSIGSVVATGTAGPLRYGFGPVRDHVLGCTIATGDGRLVTAGGRVVKNVAGYDLTKLHVGGFGGFGVITEVNLRLRAMPACDLTLTASGPMPALLAAGRRLLAAQAGVVALELLSPGLAATADWTLALRLAGTADGAEAEALRLAQATEIPWERLEGEPAAAFWSLVARAPLGGPVSFRLGALIDGVDEAVELLITSLGEGLLAAGLGSGAIRWAGEVDADRLRRLRNSFAAREIPLTLERAPWALRQAVGHFGAYREGVGRLVGRLRETFDPRGVFRVALEGEESQ